MSQLKVLIVGASIAGPTAAYWFAKAGATVTVIERFPKLRSNGQNVDIRNVGVIVMRRMVGMEEMVRAKKLDLRGISLVGNDGRSFGTIDATGNPEEQSLVSEYEIFRGDLSKILFDLTESSENINYVFDEQISSIHQTADGDGPVTVEFANHLPSTQFDLVVACDGATSRTRAMGFDCGVRDYMLPLNSWLAFFSTKKDLLEGKQSGQFYSAPGGRFMALGPDPTGVNRAFLIKFEPQGVGDMTESFREAVKQGDEELKKFVANQYSEAGWKCDEIMQHLIEADDFYAHEAVQIKLPRWYNGRFVVAGDAGYASSNGTGTSLALAGAYILAGEVKKNPNNLVTALEAYEKKMRPIVDEFQTIPSFFQYIMAPQTSWGIWIRNHVVSWVIWSRILQFGQKYWASAFASSKSYNIEEYFSIDNDVET